MKSALIEGRILFNRVNIKEVISNPNTLEKHKEALMWVEMARDFANDQGLDCDGSFQEYSHIDSNALSWIISATYPFNLTPKTWWYPIVGSVPYKGYFNQSEAKQAANLLNNEGYETIVLPVTAFSTLGWFDDPVLTPLLSRPAPEIVNTIIHECVHSTVWIKNNVEFNESLANFIALKQSVKFFNSTSCRSKHQTCKKLASQAEEIFQAELVYSGRLAQLEYQLKQIFQHSGLSPKELLEQKRNAFDDHFPPGDTYSKQLKYNNAALLHALTYHRYFSCFQNSYVCPLVEKSAIIKKILK
jgi:predicted aminopeptidase